MSTVTQTRQRPRFWWLVVALSVVIAAYGFLHAILGERLYAPLLLESFRTRSWGIFAHALLASIALLVGPFQFHRGLLLRYPVVHRTLGKIYVIAAILGSGLIGFYMAMYSYGGWTTHVAFGALAVLTAFVTALAFIRIRQGEVLAHRQWMIRSFALIFAAVTLRLLLPLLVIIHGGNFTPAYQWVSWLCWVPNLLLVELYLRKFSSRSSLSQVWS